MSANHRRLEELVAAAARPEGLTWLRAAIAAVESGSDIAERFPAVGRQLGRGLLGEGSLEVDQRGRRYVVPLAAWTVDDGGRALLLLAAARRDPDGALAIARELYFGGDARERTGALRALQLLGDRDDALAAILDAMRVNQGAIFEAAICDNAYAAAWLPALELRSAVLKCLFVGLSIRRVLGLEARADAALGQSLYDYVLEREAATRSVPPEVWPVMALAPPPGLAPKLIGYLEHPASEHRIAAAIALAVLARAGDGRLEAFLADRLARDGDAAVRALISAELGRRAE